MTHAGDLKDPVKSRASVLNGNRIIFTPLITLASGAASVTRLLDSVDVYLD